MQKSYFNLSPKETLEQLGVTSGGLTSQQAAERLNQYGPNRLAEGEKKSWISVFLEQFKDLLVAILIVAAIISMFSGNLESTLVIFAVLILNAVLGTVQYFKAEKSLESLKAMSAPSAKVLRDGQRMEVAGDQVVPGDIVELEAGDLIVADGRILNSWSLKVNESSLTGESEAVEKSREAIPGEEVALGDQKNMAFSGSLVTYGRATMVVTDTGMNTQLGRIATLMNETQQRKTPLQKNLDDFSGKLAVVIMVICVVVFLLSVFRNGIGVLDSLMFAVALAVAAIPEALSSIVTIVLAMGTQKMARQNAIIKELKAVESLGSVQVICSDKTGTLTQNRMTVQNIWADGTLTKGTDLELANDAQRTLLKIAVLDSDATINPETNAPVGDPTEVALVQLGNYFYVEAPVYRSQHPRLAELAFDSDRKLMSTLHNTDDGPMLYTKGAIDVLLDRSTHLLTGDGVVPMTPERRAEIEKVNRELSENGLRVLAFAQRPMAEARLLTLEDEQDYTFVGLISMIDPPRPESVQAVAEAKKAGIRTVMITGDHKVTATAIAKQIGIFEDGDLSVDGVELEAMSDAELDEKLPRIAVYARVSPEHKIRIVTAWQRRGCIAAMTGDGVNDAPSIKMADIGIGMGITGTDVTKNVADMVLADDNFATIVAAVEEGRRIYDNIRKSIQFLLASNMSEVLGVFGATLLGFTLLNPVHLLFINLITDCFPALALGMEPGEPDTMDRPPRRASDGIFAGGLGFDIAYQGVLITAITMISYIIGHCIEVGAFEMPKGVSPDGMTMAFLTMSMCEIFHSFNLRSQRKSVFALHTHNKALWGAMLGSLVLTTAVLEIPPVASMFGFTPVSVAEYLIALALAVLVIPIVELVKWIQRRRTRRI